MTDTKYYALILQQMSCHQKWGSESGQLAMYVACKHDGGSNRHAVAKYKSYAPTNAGNPECFA